MPITAYQLYLDHQKQANVVSALAGLAGGVGIPLSAGSLVEGLGSHMAGLGKKLPSLVGQRSGGIRDAVSKSFDAAGQKVENFGKGLGEMSHKIMNYGPGISYKSKSLTPMLFDHRDDSKLTVQRGLYWAGNAAAAGGLMHEAAGAIAPTPPNAMKVAHDDFTNLVAYMEKNV